jgi:hypothetical protein
MFTPRLTECTECANILSLIDDIDCRIAKIAGNIYNNITLMLNKTVSAEVMIDLLTYKRILQYKYVNSLYASRFSISQIANRVNLLKFKQ